MSCHCAIDTTVLEKELGLCLFFHLTWPDFLFPLGRCSEMRGCAVPYWICFPLCRGTGWHEALSALALLIRSLPKVVGTDGGENSGRQPALMEKPICMGREMMFRNMIVTDSGKIYYPSSNTVLLRGDGKYLFFSTCIVMLRIFLLRLPR